MAASTSSSKQTNLKGYSHKNSQTPASKKGKAKEQNSEPVTSPVQPEVLENGWEHHNTLWSWTSLSDPSSSRIPPLFTRDGNYFFSLVGSSVKIHSIITGIVVSTLTAPPPSNTSGSNILTSAVINPQNSFQILVATLDGRILIWDFINATLLQTINVGQHIHLMCAHERFKGTIFVAASVPRGKENDNNAVVLRISLTPSTSSRKPFEIMFIGKIRFPTGLTISSSGEWLVASAAHKVYIAKTSDLEAGFTKYVSPEHLTCLAFHPFEDYFATGDSRGVVRLWYCLNDDLAVNVRGVEKRTQTRPLHWHAHAVSSLAFSANGAYLLSGGEEAVLVIWQLHTGKKEFVPRVGAPICTVSVTKSLRSGEEEYLLGLADASYVFVGSTSLKISRSFSRLKIDPHVKSSTMKSHAIPLAVHPLTLTWILPSSHPSSLQIYSPATSSLLSELEISPSNRVSRRDEKPLIPSRVEKVVISPTGSWMATVDSRVGDSDFRPEVYLKFWSWVRKDENWSLNTRIDRPHGVHQVTDVNFNSCVRNDASTMLVSTGEDARIKIWQLRSPPGSEGGIWTPYATLTFRSETPRSVSWSFDSSLFAVAVGSHVALYDPFTKFLRQTLTAPQCPTIQFVHFINNQPGYLLASSSTILIMWNLVDDCVAWQCALPFQLDRVVLHTREARFAVFHSTAKEEHSMKVSIFHVSSSTPSSVYTLPFQLRNAVCDPSQARIDFGLIGVTHDWRAVLIGDSVGRFSDEDHSAKSINFDRQPEKRTLFQNIFGSSAFADDDLPVYDHSTPLSQKKTGLSIFDTPSFATPSLDTMFDPFMTALLSTRENRPDEVVEEDAPENGDIVMEAERGILTATRRSSRTLNPGELEAFTKLFRRSCITQESTSSTPSVVKLNGKLNKSTRSDVNGIRPSTPPPNFLAKKIHPPSPESGDDTPITPAIPAANPTPNTKKRKKRHS